MLKLREFKEKQSGVYHKPAQLFEKGKLTTTEAKARRLRPLAERLITHAKKGGILAINIADVFSAPDKGYVDIVNSMNDFLQSRGLIYKGCIGMEMTKRPNSGGAGMAVSEYYSAITSRVMLALISLNKLMLAS